LHEKLIEKAGPLLRDAAHSLFMYRNGRQLKATSLPWFLPVWACGLGLSSDTPIEENLRKRVSVLKEIYGGGVKPPRMVTDEEEKWMLFDRFNEWAAETFPLVGEQPFEKFEGDESYGAAFTAVILTIWKSKGLRAMFGAPRDKGARSKHELERAEMLWKRVESEVRRSTGFIKPCREEDLVTVVKRKVRPILSLGYLVQRSELGVRERREEREE
jgi:hypothetical protein